VLPVNKLLFDPDKAREPLDPQPSPRMTIHGWSRSCAVDAAYLGGDSCFNEARKIETDIQAALNYLSARPYSFELILVDDGSADGTAAILEKSPGARAICYQPNRGKGHAVRTGMLAASGRYGCSPTPDCAFRIQRSRKAWLCLKGAPTWRSDRERWLSHRL